MGARAKGDRSTKREWRSIRDLLCAAEAKARVALIGAPLQLGSVTPGECGRAPDVIRKALRRIGTYDVETERDVETAIVDLGDLKVAKETPATAFEAIRNAAAESVAAQDLTIILGGNNAVTRPGVAALRDLEKTGLITFDAHFDMRDTTEGLTNGNPVQALLDDGLPGENIFQIGIAPFANAKYMHDEAKDAGNRIYTMREVRKIGVRAVTRRALSKLSARCEHIYVDFDIDVIERGLAPGAPGARPGGLRTSDFFAAARLVGAHRKVRAVDLTEFDPSLDVSETTALVAGRWVAELLAGFETRA
ncbi:MAG: agmatinase family protein [Pseudomonadota bacterium]